MAFMMCMPEEIRASEKIRATVFILSLFCVCFSFCLPWNYTLSLCFLDFTTFPACFLWCLIRDIFRTKINGKWDTQISRDLSLIPPRRRTVDHPISAQFSVRNLTHRFISFMHAMSFTCFKGTMSPGFC